jgi:hypothetical protein
MNIKITLALLLSIALAGCESSSIVEAKKHIESELKDPSSAQYRQVREFSGSLVCGEYNAKNSMGGYVGFKSFIFVSATGNYISEANASEEDQSILCNNEPNKFLTYDKKKLLQYLKSASQGCRLSSGSRNEESCKWELDLVARFKEKYPSEVVPQP